MDTIQNKSEPGRRLIIGKKKAIFLDRDGTINVEIQYLHEPAKFQFIPKVPEALKKFQEAGFAIIIITNQGAIGRGMYTLEDMQKTHEFMIKQLEAYNVHIDAIYFCPHPKEEQCTCRKPQPGMILQAIYDFNIDPYNSWTIGDKISDIDAGKRANTQTLLVMTGYGEDEWKKIRQASAQNLRIIQPDATALNLWEAANLILTSRTN